jgi:hypothetical protein
MMMVFYEDIRMLDNDDGHGDVDVDDIGLVTGSPPFFSFESHADRLKKSVSSLGCDDDFISLFYEFPSIDILFYSIWPF